MELPISIIIPTFNEGKYLPNLLKSIKKQTLQPKEVIIADAFSIDNTRSVAKEYGCKVIDGGLPAVGRNQGAKAATQPYLLFLDADVILPAKFLERTMSEMVDRNLDIASCFVTPLSTLKIDYLWHEFANYYFVISKNFLPHVPGFCIFAKKNLHNKIKGFDETLFTAEDHDYAKRAKQYGSFAYLESYKIPTSVRRLNEEGRLTIALKYLLVELHLIFIGKIRKPIFTYKFGDHSIQDKLSQFQDLL